MIPLRRWRAMSRRRAVAMAIRRHGLRAALRLVNGLGQCQPMHRGTA